MQDGDRPARVGKPVGRAPRLVAEPAPHQARDHERDQQIERKRAEAHPQRAIRRGERDHRVGQLDRSEPIEHAGDDVHDEQHDHQQGNVAVQAVDREPRPARRRIPDSSNHAQHDARREQHHRHRPGGAGQIPVRAGSETGRDADQPARQPERLEPRHGSLSPDDRGGARDVRVETARGRDADGPPFALNRVARGGIDEMVRGARVRAPPAHHGARCGQSPGLKRDPLTRRVLARAVVIGDSHPPPAQYRLTRDCKVAAERDERAALRGLAGGGGRAVGRQGLGGGAQIELDPARDADRGSRRIELDAAPPRHGGD